MKKIYSPFALIAALLAAVALLLPACSDVETQTPVDVVLTGKFATTTAAGVAAKADMLQLADGDPITVSVKDFAHITTTVGADGTFTLRGLPQGSFTLIFTQAGVVIGTQVFEDVAPNQQITITVQLVSGEVVVTDEQRTGIGHAGKEIQNTIQSIVSVNLTGDSRFTIGGFTVIARPGTTAIREGNTRKTVEDLKVGTQVHVKGIVLENGEVLAYSITIQKPDDVGTGGNEKVDVCHIPPGKPEKKHTISISKSALPAHLAHGDKEGPC